MLLVILGAGASYGSADARAIEIARQNEIPAWRPPLARELFEPRSNFGTVIDGYPGARSLIVHLRHTLARGGNLEEELDKVSARAVTDPAAASQLMSVRYYLRDILAACTKNWLALVHSCTNYHLLVNRLSSWTRDRSEQVLFVTFNYDTLLEQACLDDAYIAFNSMSSYIADERIKLFKLHGSINWAHPVRFERPPELNDREHAIRYASTIEIPKTFEFRTDWSSGVRGQEWIPALAVPIQGKGSFECPVEHVDLLRSLMPEVDRLLVIGWQAAEQHFLDGIIGHAAQELRGMLIACGGKHESMATASRIQGARHSPTTRGVVNWEQNLSFSDIVAGPELDQLLK